MIKEMAGYRAQLVEVYLEGEDVLSEESIRSYVDNLDHNDVFEALGITADEGAIAKAEVEAEIEQEQALKQSIRNENYERLSKMNGAQRIAAIMDIESNGNTGSILAATDKQMLQNGKLEGVDRIAAALNARSSN